MPQAPHTAPPTSAAPTTPNPSSPTRGSGLHAQSTDNVLKVLDTQSTGLDTAEASRRLQEQGPNSLPIARRPNPVVVFLKQFHDVLIYVLLASAVVTLLIGDWIDATVIFAVTVINALVGVVQNGRSQKALEGIRSLLSLSAKTRRGGQWVNIDAADLVTGDIVRMEPGDRVPADARLLHASTLQVDESALTGESLPSDKDVRPVVVTSSIGDRSNTVFSGTHIVAGDATAIVFATGTDTEMGHIHALVTETVSAQTPLTQQLNALSRRISVLIVATAAIMLLVGWLVHQREIAQLVPATIAFAVAAIPEGLPALVTITLALGVRQMASRNAIVKKLAAVETLGSVTTICTDKTGTLTRNEMTVRTIVTSSNEYTITGIGYTPSGTITASRPSPTGHASADFGALVRVFALCNDAHLVLDDDQWQVVGDPTEGALRTFAAKTAFNEHLHERLAVIPFSPEARFMAIRDQGADGTARILLKGAPGAVLERCTHELGADGWPSPIDREHWAAEVAALTDQGLRVLAAAYSELTTPSAHLTLAEFDTDLVFLGIAGILDPPREEAVVAIATMHRAGIRVKMITGDHPGTAFAIAREMNIASSTAHVLTGEAIEEMTDEELTAVAPDVDVYARTSPEHKLRIVVALQAHGDVVAMTGDGVNDAPALRRADIGVAMGIKGTETTKEAADIVLADDNFATIGDAVEEGRRIRDNLQKSILFLLPTTSAQALVLLLAVLVGFTLPLQATQILWINLITAITLSLALATEPAESGIMDRRPRRPGHGILDPSFTGRIIWVTALITAATIGVFFLEVSLGASSSEAQTTAVTMLALGQLAFLFNCRFLRSSGLRWSVLTGNKAVYVSGGILLLLQLVFVYAPFMHPWFHSAPLGAREWGYTIAIAVLVFLLTEASKAIECRVAQKSTT